MRTFAVLSAVAAVALAQNSTTPAVSSQNVTPLVPTPASSAPGSTLSSMVSGSAPASIVTIPASLSSGLINVPAGPSGSIKVSVGSNTTVVVGSLPPGVTTTGSPAGASGAPGSGSPAGSASASASGKGAASNVQAAGAGVLGFGFMLAAMI